MSDRKQTLWECINWYMASWGTGHESRERKVLDQAIDAALADSATDAPLLSKDEEKKLASILVSGFQVSPSATTADAPPREDNHPSHDWHSSGESDGVCTECGAECDTDKAGQPCAPSPSDAAPVAWRWRQYLRPRTVESFWGGWHYQDNKPHLFDDDVETQPLYAHPEDAPDPDRYPAGYHHQTEAEHLHYEALAEDAPKDSPNSSRCTNSNRGGAGVGTQCGYEKGHDEPCFFIPDEEDAPGGPKIICLCGSSRFVAEMAIVAWNMETEGAITMGLHLLPHWYTDKAHHQAEHEGIAEKMDALHLRKIDLADEVFVVNVGGYYGDSTAREIQYARDHGKPVRFLEDKITRDPPPEVEDAPGGPYKVTDEAIRAALATEYPEGDGLVSQDIGFGMMRKILQNALNRLKGEGEKDG